MILGYAHQLSSAPGELIECMVSAEPGSYTAQLVRLHGARPSADGTTVREELIDNPINGCHKGRYQQIDHGSRIEVELNRGQSQNTLGVEMWVLATGAPTGTRVLMDLESPERAGGGLRLQTVDGVLRVQLRRGPVVIAEHDHSTPLTNEWTHLWAGYDGSALVIGTRILQAESVESSCGVDADWSICVGLVVIAAAATPNQRWTFNGKIADPVLRQTVPGIAPPDPDHVIAAWDLSASMADQVAHDCGPHGYHGKVINQPTRAVLGPHWDRRTLNWADAPRQWNAIHFHDDDIDDARWQVDFSFTAPAMSGIYAVKLTQEAEVSYIPLYVRGGSERARVLFLAPTNTYLAYGNEHLWFGERGEAHAKLMSFPIELDHAEEQLEARPELGRSLYDTHSDGSGVAYASRLRPLTNTAPNHRNWLVGGRRHFSADFFIVGWLESTGTPFDVATDEDLDREGAALFDGYDVVVTGSHPEYVTENELDAFESFSRGAGRVMYLGANGFFWVTSYTGPGRHTIEVRRGNAAQRNWTSHAAEIHHSSTGEVGAAWMHRGRDQNPVFGNGMAAAGWGTASGYARTAESYASDLAWAFTGITEDVIGADGHVLGGAAGDELDRTDLGRGTPPYARVLLSSRHSDMYQPTLENLTEVGPQLSGSVNTDVRADVVLLEHPGGGAVFATGSICWAGALGFNDYKNPVVMLTGNVLRRFLENTDPARRYHLRRR